MSDVLGGSVNECHNIPSVLNESAGLRVQIHDRRRRVRQAWSVVMGEEAMGVPRRGVDSVVVVVVVRKAGRPGRGFLYLSGRPISESASWVRVSL